MLRVAFAGTPQFAVPTLQALAASAHRLVGVLTQPDRPAGRGRQLRSSPVKQLAEELSLPLAQPERLRTPEQRAALASWQPDVLVVAAYGLILPSAVLELPRLGCINVHASLLPRWRGAAPIQRAILAGDRDTGITIMQMDAGLDTGAILAQQPVSIGATMSAQQLHDELAVLGARLLVATLDALEAGRVRGLAQSDEGACYAPKIDKREALIDWRLGVEQIDRQVRAFNPQPVAETRWRGEPLRVWEAYPAALPLGAAVNGASPPGTLLGVEREALWVCCGQGVLGLRKVQLAGRRPVLGREFAAGLSGHGGIEVPWGRMRFDPPLEPAEPDA
jgi:methionyl-tRNA formyltransferase